MDQDVLSTLLSSLHAVARFYSDATIELIAVARGKEVDIHT